jgi:hypothetical protein
MGFRARGRFDIVAVFRDGAYVRFTSNPKWSFTAAEIVAALREHANTIEAGVHAEAEQDAARLTAPPAPEAK